MALLRVTHSTPNERENEELVEPVLIIHSASLSFFYHQLLLVTSCSFSFKTILLIFGNSRRHNSLLHFLLYSLIFFTQTCLTITSIFFPLSFSLYQTQKKNKNAVHFFLSKLNRAQPN